MSLFSNQAKVNEADVSKFQTKVFEFADNNRNIERDMVIELTEMATFAEQQAKELEAIARSYEQMYSSVKELERNVERLISSLKAQLSSIPKEIEEEYTDKEGNVKVKKCPNPEYTQMQSRIKNEESRLYHIKELAFKVNNNLSYSRRVSGEVIVDAQKLKSLIPEIQSKSREILSKAENALSSLDRCIRAIQNYVSFSFRSNI